MHVASDTGTMVLQVFGVAARSSWSQFHKVFALATDANMAVHSFTVSAAQA